MVRVQCLLAALVPSWATAMNICKTEGDWSPNTQITLEGWMSATCSQASGFNFPNGFTPSEATCQETIKVQGEDVVRGVILGMMSPFCCGGAAKDACVEHMANPSQLCESPGDFQPDFVLTQFDSVKCSEIVMNHFPTTFTASAATCSAKVDVIGSDPAPAGVLMSWVPQCCGGGKDVCSDHMADPSQLCKTPADFQPGVVLTDMDDITCSEIVRYNFPSAFTASAATCSAKVDVGEDPVPAGMLMSWVPQCCGGVGKDVCAEHKADPSQICQTPGDFLPHATLAEFDNAKCSEAVSYQFFGGFVASTTTCNVVVDTGDEDDKDVTPSMVMGMVSKTCCGGPGKDVCAEYAPKVCKSQSDFVPTGSITHDGKSVPCDMAQLHMGLPPGTVTKEACAEKVGEGDEAEKRSALTEKHKETCCGGKPSICTEFEPKPETKENDTAEDAALRSCALALPLAVAAALAL